MAPVFSCVSITLSSYYQYNLYNDPVYNKIEKNPLLFLRLFGFLMVTADAPFSVTKKDNKHEGTSNDK